MEEAWFAKLTWQEASRKLPQPHLLHWCLTHTLLQHLGTLGGTQKYFQAQEGLQCTPSPAHSSPCNCGYLQRYFATYRYTEDLRRRYFQVSLYLRHLYLIRHRIMYTWHCICACLCAMYHQQAVTELHYLEPYEGKSGRFAGPCSSIIAHNCDTCLQAKEH